MSSDNLSQPGNEASFRQLLGAIRSDVRHHCESGRFLSMIALLLFNVSLKVIVCYRIQRCLNQRKWLRLNLLQMYLAYWQLTRGNCQISPKAIIGKRFKLHHPIGVVVGMGCKIGDDVSVWQNVTIGNDSRSDHYPTIENGVRIFAGSTVIGGVQLGKGCLIGAMSFVNSNIPPGSTAFGIPARVRNTSITDRKSDFE